MPADRAEKQNGTLSRRPAGSFFLAKGVAALLLYLGMSPLFLMAGAYFLPNAFSLAFLLPGAAVVLTFLAGFFSGRKRRVYFLTVLILEVCLCAAVLPFENPLALLLSLPCLLMMLLFMPALSKPLYWEWKGSLLVAGAGLHAVAQILSGNPVFAGASAVLPYFFSAYLLICLFQLNRRVISERVEDAPPPGLLKRHRRLLTLVALIALPAANWQAAKDAALAFLLFLRDAVWALIMLLASLFPEPAPASSGSEGQGLDLTALGEQTQEPSLFAQIMEKVLMGIGLLLAAALVLFGLYHLIRVMKKALRALLARLREYTRAIGEGYVDKTESLFHWNNVGRAARDRWALYQKRHQRPPDWTRLSARDKVRRVYALLLGRLKQENPAMTAREALLGGKLSVTPEEAKAMAALYEAARYSDHEISPKDAEAMRKSAGV